MNEAGATAQADAVQTIPIDRISPDQDQPRKFFEEAEEQRLADSIRRHGLIQPILVRPVEYPSYDYLIVHGERRFRAHRRLGLGTIKAIVREIEESHAKDLQLLENVQRKDLTDIELAWEFRRRVDEGQTHEQIAKIIGKDRSYVTHRLSLLKLSEHDQQRMLTGELGFSKARALLSVRDSEQRDKISRRITTDTSVKETIRIIHEETLKPDIDVTRVTSPGDVRVSELQVCSIIHDRDGGLRDTVPREELIRAFIEDLKRLREGHAHTRRTESMR
jgi:ParB family chromosome partitioning protein